jgi:hypothetical protein
MIIGPGDHDIGVSTLSKVDITNEYKKTNSYFAMFP